MSATLSRASVAVCTRMLKNLDACIDKAEAQVTQRKWDADALLLARLFPDMFHFTRQVQASTDQARNLGRLIGVEPPKFENTERSFADLKARIGKTLAFLGALDSKQIDAAAESLVTLTMAGQSTQMTASDYLHDLIMPNFYFHVTSAYAILRHNGIDLGKRDFLGFR